MQALRELGKTAKEFGEESPHFTMVLETILDENILVPNDAKKIFGGLLTPPRFLVWEKMWQGKLRTLLEVYKHNPGRAFLTLQHLAGEGDWSKSQDQAAVIPSPVLKEITEAARVAFYNVPVPGMPAQRFATLCQEPGEDICQFVQRVQASVEKQITDKKARQETIISIIKNNANELCRQAIRTLPRHPPPTLGEIIETCMDLPPETVPPFNKKQKHHANTFAAQQPGKEKSTMTGRCFICGQPGHFTKVCPKKQKLNPVAQECLSGPGKNCPPVSGNGQ